MSTSSVTAFNRLVAFTQGAGGMRSIASALDVGAQWLLLLSSWNQGQRASIESMQQKGNVNSNLFNFPALITGSYDLCCSVIALNFKKTIVDGLSLVNTGTEALGFAHDVKWIDLDKSAVPVSVIYNVTTCILDGWEAADKIQKTDEYFKKTPADYYGLKTRLAQITIAKDVASVAMAAISLLSLLLGALLTDRYMVTPIMLGLSTIYLTARISSFFYEKMIEEEKRKSNLV